jgi:hypothetical protein
MSTRTFQKAGIQKFFALIDAVNQVVPNTGMWYNDPEIKIQTDTELTQEQITNIQSIIDNYTDPAVYLQLNSTTTDVNTSRTTNSTTPETVKTFIFTCTNQFGTGVFNAIKTVVEYSCTSTTPFASFESTNASAIIEFYDRSRDIVLESHTINISDIIADWKEYAENGDSSAKSVFRSFMVEGMRNHSASFDTIWQIKAGVSDSNIRMTLHGLQFLYYDLL